MAKHEYELLGGQHHELNPLFTGNNAHDPEKYIKYVKGDKIPSDRELDKIFPEHFRKVLDREAQPASPARKDAVGGLITCGAWAEDDRSFLESLTEADFDRVRRCSATRTAEQEPARVTSTLGEDVTDKFQQAYDHGFKVFRNAAGKHQVVKPPNMNKPLNLKPLVADKVEEFVASYLQETK